MTISTNIYIMRDWINELIKEIEDSDNPYIGGNIHLSNRICRPNWRNNPRLLEANYEKMKNSRKKIIQQRDNLKKRNEKLINNIIELEEYRKLKNENVDLYNTIYSNNATIQKLKIENEQLRKEKEEYQRRYNLIKQITGGKI
jgi:hypothetical protein